MPVHKKFPSARFVIRTPSAFAIHGLIITCALLLLGRNCVSNWTVSRLSCLPHAPCLSFSAMMVRRLLLGDKFSRQPVEDRLPYPSAEEASTIDSTGTSAPAPRRTPLSRHPSLETSRRLLFPQSLPDDVQEPLTLAFGALRFSSNEGSASRRGVSPLSAPEQAALSQRWASQQGGSRSDEPPLLCSRSAPAERSAGQPRGRTTRSSLTFLECHRERRQEHPFKESCLFDGPWLSGGAHRLGRSVEGSVADSCADTAEALLESGGSDSGGSDSVRAKNEDMPFPTPMKRLRGAPPRESSCSVAPQAVMQAESRRRTRAPRQRGSEAENEAGDSPPSTLPVAPGAKPRRIGGFIGFLLSLFTPRAPDPACALPPQANDGDASISSLRYELSPSAACASDSCSLPTCPCSSLAGGACTHTFPAPSPHAGGVFVPTSASLEGAPPGPPFASGRLAPLPPPESTAWPPRCRRGVDPRDCVHAPGASQPFALSPALSAGVTVYTRTAHFADAAQRVLRLLWSCCCVGVLLWLLLHLAFSLYRDIQQGEEQRQLRTAAEAAHCRQHHRENGCDTLDPLPPYLHQPCSEWKTCLMREPGSHGERTKVMAAVVGDVLNAFFQRLEWRTIACLALLLLAVIYATSWISQPIAPPLIPPRLREEPRPTASSLAPFGGETPQPLPALPETHAFGVSPWKAREEAHAKVHAERHGSHLFGDSSANVEAERRRADTRLWGRRRESPGHHDKVL
ncbi:Di-sulfide bridge nucleocytoplasmic transport domain protein [Toxoplasma gondii VAND]|uniref:Di-sulfide bridge nucleocytoplasmic transport domain protein n=1 Tax=Toxoplasma gondii VAND TaxID=933077 RepID=A0A086QCY4_TOXGO|nr:Di-sulfide bridge nucleocytoplasmic transport domain protein [Toxoplasma gondii VAND]